VLDKQVSRSVRPKFSLLHQPPPRVGLFVDWLMDPYQTAVLAGARAAAEEWGASLIAFPGGILGSPHRNGAQRNHLFDVAGREQLDAVVVLGGTLGNHLGVEALAELCAQFRGKPVVSIAVEVPGCSLVRVNNGAGMREALEHLIRQHSRRRVAFIRGPRANAEAEARFSAYREALEGAGLPLDEALVAPGAFQRSCGRDAVRHWLDERRIPVGELDAIVGAADLMVLGALDELTERGVRVPEDVALVGFDDIDQARFTTPPLSTVRQPLFEQGREAVRMALLQINGEQSTGSQREPERLELPTRFVGRRSCGCFSREPAEGSFPPISSRLSLNAQLVARRQILRAELARASRGSFTGAGAGWEDRLLNALAEELDGRSGAFVDAYYRVLQAVMVAGGDLSVCHPVIGALRRQLLALVGDDAVTLRRVEHLLHELRVMTSEILERHQAMQRIQAEARARELSQVSARLVAALEFDRLTASIREELPRLGIGSCLVVRYVDAEHVEPVAGYLPGGEEVPRSRYPAKEIVPRAIFDEAAAVQLTLIPLSFDGHPFGYVVFELGQLDGHVYESLGEIIGAALRSAGLTAILARTTGSSHPLAAREAAGTPTT